MLVQFSVRNFKTFKNEAKLTLFASNYDKSTRETDNVFEVPEFGLRLLKSLVIYGANASGKTKLVDAMHFMRKFVKDSSKESQQGEPIDTEPFRLSTATSDEPSMFELIFIHEGEMFRYGFEVTAESVVSEWLYNQRKSKKTQEVEIFYREGQTFTVHPKLFKKGRFFVQEKMVRPNSLMLSVAAQFNDELSKRVFDWLRKFRQLSGLKEDGYMGYSMHRAQTTDGKKKMLELLQKADTGIEDFTVQPMDIAGLPDDFPQELKEMLTKKRKEGGTTVFTDVKTFHTKYDENNTPAGLEEFKMTQQESSGTVKFFALSGPVINALEEGEVLVVDELDSKIHPNLVCKLVDLFNSAVTNPKNAQLIFNTHDTNLLGVGMFRRDQTWFVEKDRYGAASLYSLAAFKTDEGARKNDNYEENYINGRYGAVPVLGDFAAMFQTAKSNGK